MNISTPNGVIAIMAKAPIAGLCKTRMLPELSAKQAAKLQERLIDHTVKTCLNAKLAPIQIWHTPDTKYFNQYQSGVITCHKQPEDEDLGGRMKFVFDSNKDSDFVIVIGTDCPLIDNKHLYKLANELKETDISIIPAIDGGYVAIASSITPNCFKEINWGTETVLKQTKQQIEKHKYRLSLLNALPDLDYFADFSSINEDLKRKLLSNL